MPKLGTMLVKAGVISSAQLDEAVRAQVFWGARLGTNLVELEHLDLDTLARFLGRQHQLVAVLGKDFDGLDPDLAARLPVELAATHKVVPIGVLVGEPRRVALASIDPLGPGAQQAVAAALGVELPQLALGIAGELRIHYQLERVYGLERDARFLRVRRAPSPQVIAPPMVVAEDFDVESAVDIQIDVDLTPVEAEPSRRAATPPIVGPATDAGAELDPPTFELEPSDGQVVEPAVESPSNRRRFVRTLTDEPRGETLGRIAVTKRRVALAESSAQPASVEEALRAIRRGVGRDIVGDRAVRLLARFGAGDLGAYGLLVVRGEVAMAWKGEIAGGAAFEAIAVPLTEPSLLVGPAQARTVDTDDPRLVDLDHRLLAATGGSAARYVVVAPVTIGEHTLCFVYGHGDGDPVAAEQLVTAVAGAVAVALVRLIRAAQR
ncbi:MAG: hypothetical protein KA297_06480 [Kofleriaceae bacterium]|nr:hypothetical protein [Kofleriaceae bacterium]